MENENLDTQEPSIEAPSSNDIQETYIKYIDVLSNMVVIDIGMGVSVDCSQLFENRVMFYGKNNLNMEWIEKYPFNGRIYSDNVDEFNPNVREIIDGLLAQASNLYIEIQEKIRIDAELLEQQRAIEEQAKQAEEQAQQNGEEVPNS